jgi:WD40 repeat protein
MLTAAASSPDRRTLAMSLQNAFYGSNFSRPLPGNTIKLFDAQTGNLRRVVARSNEAMTMLSFSPGGTLLAGGGESGTVQLWNLVGKTSRKLSGHLGRIDAIAFSCDGSLLATAGKDSVVQFHDTSKGTLKRTLRGLDSRIASMVFSPDNGVLVTGSRDGTVRLWRLK